MEELIFEDNFKDTRGRKIKKIKYLINENECWICNSHFKDKDGYPKAKRNGKSVRLSRYVYQLHFNKTIEEGMFMLHSCDNPNCINPNHLREGTLQENSKDMVARGRSMKGVKPEKRKIDQETANIIRKRYSVESISQKKLGDEYGISHQQVSKIIRRERW